MIIRIPSFVANAWDKWVDWANVPVWDFKKQGFDICRLDLIVAAATVATTIYAYWRYNWAIAIATGGSSVLMSAFIIYVKTKLGDDEDDDRHHATNATVAPGHAQPGRADRDARHP